MRLSLATGDGFAAGGGVFGQAMLAEKEQLHQQLLSEQAMVVEKKWGVPNVQTTKPPVIEWEAEQAAVVVGICI